MKAGGFDRFVLGPVCFGAPCHLVAPAIRTLPLWLETISAVGGTVTGAPDFAYRLATRLVELRGIDLSSLRYATNGGEPVRQSTIAAFEERFGIPGIIRPAAAVARTPSPSLPRGAGEGAPSHSGFVEASPLSRSAGEGPGEGASASPVTISTLPCVQRATSGIRGTPASRARAKGPRASSSEALRQRRTGTHELRYRLRDRGLLLHRSAGISSGPGTGRSAPAPFRP